MNKKCNQLKKELERAKKARSKKLNEATKIADANDVKLKDVVHVLRKRFITYMNAHVKKKHAIDEFCIAAADKLQISKARVKSALMNSTYKDDTYQIFVDGLKYDTRSIDAGGGAIPIEELLDKLQTNSSVSRFNGKPYMYNEFLRTRYWNTIHDFLVKERRKCEHCGRNHNLSCHHLSYYYVGIEWLHLNSLVVLCTGCHEREHKRIEKTYGKNSYPHHVLDLIPSKLSDYVQVKCGNIDDL